MFSSVRTRLVLLFFAITAAAVGFIYLYVVPQLQSSLTAEKLRRLETAGAEQAQILSDAMGRSPSQAELRRLVRRLQPRAGARVTLLGVRDNGGAGPEPSFVIADSDLERTAVIPSYPSAGTAVATGRTATAVESIAGERMGETSVPLSQGAQPRWVAVLTIPLAEVDDNVSLIKRQILIGGSIALVAALAAAWFAARAHARRLRRLETAAEKVAEGDFATPIPIDGPDEVGQLAETLNEMRVKLERLDSARKEFIANASHELRTPIFSLGGFVELLDEEDPDPESRAEFVTTMREQVDRLTKLATDLLDLSKLDADALQLRAEAVDLSVAGAAIADEFRPAAETHGSPLVTLGGDPVVAAGDPGRIAQIVRILIDNALAHTPEGTSIKVTASLQQGEPTLTVADDGPGIDAQKRDRVFERFYTGDEVSGSGLGLAIARELARLMGGDVDLTSRRGHTEFTLRLPAANRAGTGA